jgi:hypothetical protein
VILAESERSGGIDRDEDSLVLRRAAIALFALGLIGSFAALVATWNQPVLESQSFRQTQNGLTSYWLAHGGPWFSYETPMLGAPWAVPFEAPLYQGIVAVVHRLLGLNLDSAGRLVSWVFFLLTLWQVHAVVRKLGGSKHLGLLLCGLLLLSPFYVFWSRTFMMESTALFLSVAFVSATLSHVQTPRVATVIAMVVLASLAGLVKVTTFVPFGIAGVLVVLWDLRDRAHWKDKRRWLVRYAPVALAGLVAIAVVALWEHHANVLKLAHPFGRNLTSKRLRPWVYGTLAQRFDFAIWRDVVFGRTLDEALGGAAALVFSIAAAIAFRGNALRWAAVLLGLYLIPFLAFMNLHAIHDYYQYANALFVVCLVGVVVWYARDGWQRWFSIALLVFVVGSQVIRVARFWPQMVASLDASDTMSLHRATQDLPEDGVLLVFGYDWSAEVAYYTNHRTMNVPNWASRKQLESLRDQPMVHTGGLPIIAVVDCPNPLSLSPELGPIVETILADATRGMHPSKVARCTLWR